MEPRPHICIIVPAHNEAKIIRQTILELLAERYQVIVVDDASSDGTAEQISDLDIHFLQHATNLGQGAALQTGMDYAKGLNARYVVHFDADGQHQVSDIPTLLAPLMQGEADIALGSRFMRASDEAAIPARRRWLLKGAIIVNGVFTGMWLSDAHNGFRALNHRALHAIRFTENGMAHATEILEEIRRHALRHCEVPVDIRYTEYARAKGQTTWHAIGIFSDLVLRKMFPL